MRSQVFFASVLALAVIASISHAQGFDPGPIQNPGTQPVTDPGPVTQDPTQDPGGGNVDQRDGPGQLESVGETLEDERSQGFVGPSQARIQEQETIFIGPTKQRIEEITPSVSTGNINRSFSGNGGGSPGFTGFGNNGYSISRSNVRARVRPNFSFRTIPSQVVARGFQQRISKLPIRNSVSGVNIRVEGTTATISGVAETQQDLDNVIGQLQLEPGVYRIVNEVQVATQKPLPSGLSSNN